MSSYLLISVSLENKYTGTHPMKHKENKFHESLGSEY